MLLMNAATRECNVKERYEDDNALLTLLPPLVMPFRGHMSNRSQMNDVKRTIQEPCSYNPAIRTHKRGRGGGGGTIGGPICGIVLEGSTAWCR